MRVVQSDARRAGARCAGVVGACGWQPKRTRPERRTRPCSRPLRARDRWHFSALVCSALAAADGQTVRRPWQRDAIPFLMWMNNCASERPVVPRAIALEIYEVRALYVL